MIAFIDDPHDHLETLSAQHLKTVGTHCGPSVSQHFHVLLVHLLCLNPSEIDSFGLFAIRSDYVSMLRIHLMQKQKK